MADLHAARIERCRPCGMILLRGALEAGWMQGLLANMGLAQPERRKLIDSGAGRVIWLSPDELLILCEADHTGALLDRMQTVCDAAGHHTLIADISDARLRFAISGPGSRACLAKLCPVDLAPGRFDPGEVRRTRLAQVACAFWMTDPERFELICFRSVADYAEAVLQQAARHIDGTLSL